MRKNSSAIDTEDREWSLLSVYSKANEEITESLAKTIKKETNMKVEKIELVSKNYYHARLTDYNVNNIQRDEFQLLNFFTLTEAKKLLLTYPTKNFLDNHADLIPA